MSLTPESAHMLMWVMSDRALPRSFAMMEGFGVHTFRLVNAKGKSRFVKFHWKPIKGVKSLLRRVGPNFAELPINRPLDPVHNNQRDGMARTVINKGRVAYFPNRLGGGCPVHSSEAAEAFVSYAENGRRENSRAQ